MLTDSADLYFPPLSPPLSPTNLTFAVEFDNDLPLPPPSSPSNYDILVTNETLIIPHLRNLPPSMMCCPLITNWFCFDSLLTLVLILMILICLEVYVKAWKRLSFFHSPSLRLFDKGMANFPPRFDFVEVSIQMTPDRLLRELNYTIHEKLLQKNGHTLFYGRGFKFRKGGKSIIWRCKSRSIQKKLQGKGNMFINLIMV